MRMIIRTIIIKNIPYISALHVTTNIIYLSKLDHYLYIKGAK